MLAQVLLVKSETLVLRIVQTRETASRGTPAPSLSRSVPLTAGVSLLAGTSYGLAACFVVHLMTRAYWVGLIGLRTVFPEGIKWDKTPGLGPLSRQYYRDTLPDLDTVIECTDRLASSLFAVISMLTLILLWLGTILIANLVVSDS